MTIPLCFLVFCFWAGTLHEIVKELEGASGIGSWGVLWVFFLCDNGNGLRHWIMTSSKAADDGIQDAMYITTTTL